MSSDEIHALVAYFEASAGESPAQPTSSRIALLLVGLVGAAAACFRLRRDLEASLSKCSSTAWWTPLRPNHLDQRKCTDEYRSRRNCLDSRRSQSARSAVGRVLPQPVAARQSCPQHARRELHGWLHVEHSRQRRHCHLGDARTGLPAARSRHCRPTNREVASVASRTAGISTVRCESSIPTFVVR